MPIKAYYLNPKGTVEQNLTKEQVKTAFESGEGLLWVDIAETTVEEGVYLEEIFHFHHLAIDDCVSSVIHPPKIDDFGDYLFVVVHGINHAAESEIVETAELAIFLGPNFVVSNHNTYLYCAEAVKRFVEDNGRPMRRGADFLAYTLIDYLIDNIVPTIDKMSEVAEEIEEEVINSPQQATLSGIMKLKRSTLRIHRVLMPQRDILNRLSRGEFPIIRGEAQIYYRDVYDRIVRVADLNQALRDRSDNALNTYLSSVANRQNEVMKVLSIVAAIFLPLTLVAGIYGMNFRNMPELDVPWGYFAVLGFMGVVIIGVVWWFWARRWLTWGRHKIKRVKPFIVEPEKLRGYFTKFTRRSKAK